MNYSLRPYQLHKVAEARAMMGSGKTSICLVSPCGSGKTVIAAHIILSEDQLRCLPRHPRGWWKQPASEQ